MQKILITAPAHLHAGNMDLTGDLGRLYGTAGFTIDHPKTVVEAVRSDKLRVIGEDKENATRYAKAFMEKYRTGGGAELNVREAIPKHLGMGSQTSLALSIGKAIAELYGLKTDLEEIALTLGRSDIVALGLNSFKSGGFIVDGGYMIKHKGKKVPPLLFRHPIPENWLFIVCIPKKPIPPILKIKEDEERILKNLKPMPAEMSDRLSRIMLMQVMPSLIEEDIEAFGKAITAFNSHLGDFWGEFQREGTYCHPIVEAGVNILLDNGAYGACQTCWGPTFYGLVDSVDSVKGLIKKLKSLLEKQGGGDVFQTKGNNQGAAIKKW